MAKTKVTKTLNLKELANKQLEVYDSLFYNDGVYDLKTAAEINNTTGKIINLIRIQLETAKYLKERPSSKDLLLTK